jgi:hypothetical protein
MTLQDKIFSVNTEADYFGFSYQLAKCLNKKNVPVSLSSLQHGWNPFEPAYPERYFHSYEKTKLVVNDDVSRFLRLAGYKSYAVGLPFINFLHFSQDPIKKRESGTILIAMRHSHPHFTYSLSLNAQKIFDTYSKFGDISFLIPPSDVEKYAEFLESNPEVGVEYGANLFDQNSFPRLKSIFSNYEYLISSSWGSQLIYAAACGMKVGITKRFFEAFNSSDFEKNPWYKKYPYLVDNICAEASLENVMNKFPYLFVDDYLPTTDKEAPCFITHMGFTDPQLLADLLGWNSRTGQIGFTIKNRCKKALKLII